MRVLAFAIVVSVFIGTALYAEETQKEQAVTLVKQAAALIEKEGVDKTIVALNNPEGAFVKGALYVFAYDTVGAMMAHPKNAKLIGKNLIEVPDVDGKLFRKEIIAMALDKGTGWVDYKYKNPTSNKVEEKTTYVLKSKSLVLCCGIYK